MSITQLKPKRLSANAGDLLKPFKDGKEVANWAASSIADCLASGVVSGRSPAKLAPKAYISRAEVAAIIQGLLQKSDRI